MEVSKGGLHWAAVLLLLCLPGPLIAQSTATVAEPFFRKPDFQLRAFGAFSPAVSFSRNDSASRSRQPVIVTAATLGAVAFDSTGDGTTADSVSAAIAAGPAVAGVVEAVACGCGRGGAASGRTSDVAAPMTIAAPRKHSTPITIVRVLIVPIDWVSLVRKFAARDFFERSTFFIRMNSSPIGAVLQQSQYRAGDGAS